MNPAVVTLQLHLDGCQTVNFKDNTNINNIAESAFLSRTMLTQFFWMNNHNNSAKEKKLLYKDFPSLFVWDTQSRIWTERKARNVIGRIATSNPNQGERYYLRLLLGHVRGPKSYAQSMELSILQTDRLALHWDYYKMTKAMKSACKKQLDIKCQHP